MSSAPYDAIVIGSGMTGLTAAKHLAERGACIANIEGGVFGGLITNVNELEGEFGGSGADLASTLMNDVIDLGCTMLSESVVDVRRDGADLVVVSDAAEHRARMVVVATGAKLRRLGVPGEAEYEYKGVSQCPDCDGPMFQAQHVVVVGGGDSALQEAVVLSRFCASVRIVHRGGQLTAQSHWQHAIAALGNVTIMPATEVTQIEGGDVVQALRVRSVVDGSVQTLRCSGVFVYVGLEPSSGLLADRADCDASGALVTDDAFETSLPGVFAAGAVRAGYQGTLSDAVRDAQAVAKAVLQRLRD
ncbi:MAG TPA: FAD-dependent oxidoreductase [Casimicrobiaceae bacterium]|nr:FAD-dependent oxidoreductase [Casimicrobiaceae bacterium]